MNRKVSQGGMLGVGWAQEARLTINGAVVQGWFSEWPADSHIGHIAAGGAILRNEIPIARDYRSRIELRFESWSAIISMVGTGAKLESIGAAEYVGEFTP